MNDERLKDKTGHTAAEWVAVMEKAAGTPIVEIEHAAMAEIAVNEGVTEWWAQGVAVSVEQHIGRRVVGQTCRGTYSANASKTFAGEWKETFTKFCAFMEDNLDLLPAPPESEPRITESEKWRYWKIDLVDDSKASVNVQDKTPAKEGAPRKVTFAVSHDNVGSMEARESNKLAWTNLFDAFQSSLN